ncbi:dodecin domain-containing protein [Bradyrhizobium sp. P5_C11_2]
MKVAISHIYSVTKTYGSSPSCRDGLIRRAIATAQQTIDRPEWLQVTEAGGHSASDGSFGHFQLQVKLGFCLDRRSGKKK